MVWNSNIIIYIFVLLKSFLSREPSEKMSTLQHKVILCIDDVMVNE